MAKKPQAPAPVEDEIKDTVQSPNVEPEKVENAVVAPDPAPVAEKPALPAPAAKLEQYNATTHILVDRKLFNKMITSLIYNKGLMFYTGQGLTTQLGEMLGLKKDEPGFYEKARQIAHNILTEHQKK